MGTDIREDDSEGKTGQQTVKKEQVLEGAST